MLHNMKVSLPIKKQRGDDLAASLEHNKRNKSSRYNPRLTYRSNKDRLHLNLHWENPIYANVNSSTELWELLREDYDYAKANNLTTRKRFISRTTNSRFKGTIETSITREIIFQIGKKGDTLVVPIEIFIHFIDWFKYEYEGDIIRWDIHDDEGTRHLHILVTTWNMEHHENYTLNSLVDTYHKFQSASYEELKPLCEQFNIKLQPSDGNDKHIPILMHERHILVVETIVHKYESKARVLKRFVRKLINIIRNLKQECIKLEDQCEVTLTNLKSSKEELIHKTELVHKKDQELRALTEEHETKVKEYEEYSNQLEQKIKQQRQESNSLANKIINDKHVLLNLGDEISKYTQQRVKALNELQQVEQELKAATQEYTTKGRSYKEHLNQLEQKIKQQRQESNDLDNKLNNGKHMLLKLREETNRHTKQNALALENTKRVNVELKIQEETYSNLEEKLHGKSIPIIENLLEKLKACDSKTALKIIRDYTEDTEDDIDPDTGEKIYKLWR